MGGEREETVTQKSKKSDGKTETVGTVRFHESGGEVHFHDDANNLKVAIPVATWFNLWAKLNQQGLKGKKKKAKMSFTDSKHKTVLNVQLNLVSLKDQKPTLEVYLTVDGIDVSDEYAKLNKLTA